MLNSKDYESFIESHAESVMFTLKSQLLGRPEKDLLRKALFLYQKNLYEKVGDLPETQRDLISEIADKLNLKY